MLVQSDNLFNVITCFYLLSLLNFHKKPLIENINKSYVYREKNTPPLQFTNIHMHLHTEQLYQHSYIWLHKKKKNNTDAILFQLLYRERWDTD